MTNEVEVELQRRLNADGRRHVEANRVVGRNEHLHYVPTIECTDGFRMSVQASAFHYCSPRDSNGPWSAVEVGFPSERVEQFMPFIDGGDSDPTDTVYGYVPLSTVAEVIAAHGGFAA